MLQRKSKSGFERAVRQVAAMGLSLAWGLTLCAQQPVVVKVVLNLVHIL